MKNLVRVGGLIVVLGLLLGPGLWQSHGQAEGQKDGEKQTKKQTVSTPVAAGTPLQRATSLAPNRVSATITVTSLGDDFANAANCPGANCRLRDAIAKAVNGDTIDFAVTGTINITEAVDTFILNKNLTINGPGPSQLAISGRTGPTNATQVFKITAGSTVVLNALKITEGNGFFGGGGGINNSGTLTVTSSLITDNSASGGAGISNETGGTLTLNNCTLSSNVANTFGGGINNTGSTLTLSNCTLTGNSAAFGGALNNSGVLTISNSTISGNTASSNGGGLSLGGTVIVTNSTISGNTAAGTAGGINTSSTLTLTNCTISGNTSNGASGGGGIFRISGTVNARNTLIGGNTATTGPDFNGTLTSQGYNLIGNTSGTTISGDPTGNLLNVNAMLDTLANNGGTTQTRALQSGSPAMNAATDVTTLNGAIDNLTTSIVLTSATAFPANIGFVIQIDSEQMLVTAKSANTLTVSRAANATTAAAHNTGVGVNPACDQRGSGFNRKTGSAIDIGAFEVQTITAIDLLSFSASTYDHGTLFDWQTGAEAGNLGFRLYRDAGGKRLLMTPSLIAGAALKTGADLRSGETYSWWDADSSPSASYWLEDLDLNGKSTWHGPFFTKAVGGAPPSRAQAVALAALGQSASPTATTYPVEPLAPALRPSTEKLSTQATLAAQSALKIAVQHAGWYRLTAAELQAAGFNTSTDARLWQLFVEGQEVPLLISTVIGKDSGTANINDTLAAIEFYGLGIDTPSTETRIYWLTVGSQQGMRIPQTKGEGVSALSPSFTQTVERRERSIYFAALRNGEAENFFGAVVANQPVEQTLTLNHLAPQTTEAAILEVALQGVTMQPHRVLVQVNGSTAGYVDFQGQQPGTAKFSLPQALLRDGINTVRLIAQNGSSDVSLVNHLRLSYQHTYTADDNTLQFSATGNQRLTLEGFTSKAIRVFDVTDATNPQELLGEVSNDRNSYRITVAPIQNGERRLLALSDEQLKQPVSLSLNEASNWRNENNAADLVIVSPRAFFPTLEPLKALRESQGLRVALLDIEDLYDEFSFGTKSVQAVRDFFSYAKTRWKQAPRFALLVGDASYDAKNYLGYGMNDLLPTKLVDTDYLETSSDDWLADFDNDGISDIAIGRLPVRTPAEINAVVAKLLRYEQTQTPAAALLVADRNEGYDFEAASVSLRGWLGNLSIEDVRRGQLRPEEAKKRLLDGLTSGKRLVNYVGHGSATSWNGSLLTATEAEGLTNEALPVLVAMTCLNGYFADPANESLGEAVVKAPNGGAVAAWVSTGMTLPQGQAAVNQEFYRLLWQEGAKGLTVGEAARQAKRATPDQDVRRTWVLLGDPSLRLR